MSIGCLSRTSSGVPDVITDTSTMSITLDNQGMATLQITVLTKKTDPITNSCYTFQLSGNVFRGFIESDVPRKLEGSDYFEHNITARGEIC